MYQMGAAGVLCTCKVAVPVLGGDPSAAHPQMSNWPGVPADNTSPIFVTALRANAVCSSNLPEPLQPADRGPGSNNGPAPESQAAEGEVASCRHRHTRWYTAMTAPGGHTGARFVKNTGRPE